MEWTSIINTAITAIVAPLLLFIANLGVQRYVKNGLLSQFASGAIVAAGRALVTVANARQLDPKADLKSLIDQSARAELGGLMSKYSETIASLGITEVDALSRIKGELGVRLPQPPIQVPIK